MFPIPVITGIGHTTNETVIEMISFSNGITPTKIAEYLIQNFHNFSVPVRNAEEKIIEMSGRLITDVKGNLHAEVKLFRSVTDNILIEHRNQVKRQVQRIQQQSIFLLKMQQGYLKSLSDAMKRSVYALCIDLNREIKHLAADLKKEITTQFRQINLLLIGIEKNIKIMSPRNVLKRGFSITFHNGVAIKDINQVKNDELIETVVFNGKIKSLVKTTKKQHKNE